MENAKKYITQQNMIKIKPAKTHIPYKQNKTTYHGLNQQKPIKPVQ